MMRFIETLDSVTKNNEAKMSKEERLSYHITALTFYDVT